MPNDSDKDTAQSQPRLEELIEFLPDIVLLVARGSGRILGANAAALNAYGYSREELLSLTIHDLRAPETVDSISSQMALADQAGTRFQTVHQKKNGTTFPVEVNSRGATIGGRRILLSAVRDITESKRFATTLATSESRYRSLFDHLNIGVFVAKPDGSLQQVNPMLVRLSGYDSAEEILALPLGGLAADPEARRQHYLGLMARDGSVSDIEFKLLRKDGSVCPVSVNAVALRDTPDGGVQVLGTVEDITERKRTEETLRQSQELFALFMMHSPIHVFIKEIKGNESFVLQASDSYKEMIGMIGREMRGKTMGELFPAELAAKITADDQVVIDHNTVVKREEEFNGRYYSTIKFPILQGASRLLAGYTVDITERVLAEKTQTLLNDLILELNSCSNLTEGLHKVLRTTTQFACYDCGGIYLADPADKSLTLAAHIGLSKEFISRVSRYNGDSPNTILASSGQAQYGEYSVMRPNRSPEESSILEKESLRAFAMIPIMSQGKLIALLNLSSHSHESVPSDIRRAVETIAFHVGGSLLRLRTDAALRETEAILSAFLDSAVDSICILDSELKFVRINPRGLEIIGKKRDEIIGKGIADVVPDVISSGRYAKHLEVIRTGKPYVIDHFAPHPLFGEMHFLLISFKVGSGLGVIAHDITDRVKAQRERDALQEKVNSAQRLESVGRLAGGVAHDFNNMLTIIEMITEQAITKVDPSLPLRSDLQDILDAAARSAELTRQLLAFARKQTITPRVLDLNACVEGMLNMLRPIVGENLEIAWHPEPDLWPVFMDPSQIDQLLANLCVNSRDAISDVGKITIDTSNQSFDEAFCANNPGFLPGDYVQVCVSDNGCGMDQETQAQIFEPFFTTKEEGKGTGLGLSTVYGIVKQNNGFLKVVSAPQQGTAFMIYLPRHASRVKQTQPEKARSTRPGSETILVVEDEVVILRLIKTILETLGYAVLATHTPSDAIRTAREHPGEIHLLLTDVVMPEMNGRDLAKNIQSLHPSARCMFMSGYTADVISSHGVVEEGISFIQKPFTVKDLSAKVRAALDKVRES